MPQSSSRLDRDIRVVIVGIGSIGKGIAYQAQITPGFTCVGIANRHIDKAIACAEWLARPYQIVHSRQEMHAAIEAGRLAVTDDGNLVAQCELADALIECSGAIYDGARHVISALRNGLHAIMMNAEADLIYGPLLLSVAESEGRVYTSCDGDEPAVIKRIVDDILFWGFDLVMAGNIKGYLDRYANPTTIVPEADKRELDYKMCTSFTDGTKTNIEMALVANALNLRTAVPGMLGPAAAHVSQVFDVFDFDALWQPQQRPLVDYLLGAEPKGGVFVIAFTDSPYQQHTLQWFPPDMGPGPYYLFYRPYHLRHIEALNTVRDAVLYGRPLLKPDYGFKTNVYAYARKALKQGDRLDGIGGYTCFGQIENVQEDNGSSPGLPICLSDRVVLRRAIEKDQRIALQDTIVDADAPQFGLYAEALAVSNRRSPVVDAAPGSHDSRRT